MTQRSGAPPSEAGAGGLKHSPLHQQHVAAGARFAEFSGWSMPLEYAGAGVLAEHAAVRNAVGIFDVSHLGKATVAGPGATAFVNACLTADLNRIVPGQAQYTFLCNDQGGVVDDLIAYRRFDDEVFLIPNAANTSTVVEILAAAAPTAVSVTNRHDDFVILAVQGPRCEAVLAAAGLATGHGYMSFVSVEFAGGELTLCRTGYTGERGYELVAPAQVAPQLWEALLAAGEPYGLQPAGLGARDTLRTEMGYALHGHEIAPDITPVQARLGWAVGWTKPEFFGRSALHAEKAAGPVRVLRGLKAARRGIPRPGMAVLDDDGLEIGRITSGTFSPTLKTGIALALVNADFGDGDAVAVDIRGRAESFVLTRPPFVATSVREA